jgi:hypothetical protein
MAWEKPPPLSQNFLSGMRCLPLYLYTWRQAAQIQPLPASRARERHLWVFNAGGGAMTGKERRPPGFGFLLIKTICIVHYYTSLIGIVNTHYQNFGYFITFSLEFYARTPCRKEPALTMADNGLTTG